MTCNPKHFTYQTEKRERSPQLPLPPAPPVRLAPQTPAKAEEDHIHIGSSGPYTLGVDWGRGDSSCAVVVDAQGRVVQRL